MPPPLPPRKTPLRIRTTPAPRQSFPLLSTTFFTGSLFDTLVIFLQKHSIEWHSIQCVLRGDHPSTAVPTICISITSPDDMSVVEELWREEKGLLGFSNCGGGGGEAGGGGRGGGGRRNSLDDLVPEEVKEVEFARVFADLVGGVGGGYNSGGGAAGGGVGLGNSGTGAASSTCAGGSGGGLGGFLGTGSMGASIASLVAASLKSAPNRSDLSLVACTCPPIKLAETAAADRVPRGRRGGGGGGVSLRVRTGGEGPMDDNDDEDDEDGGGGVAYEDDEDEDDEDDEYYGCEIMEHQAACPTHGGD
ncbi:hypothetical protein DFH27DRAFT_603688 [Peziza echinospora]|nr:hypothetical protein DFH27DRAFT_603688 [Peziza echinospora]